MEVWRLFRPLPVTMITSVEENGEFRCSPFTWLLPVSKGNEFIVMMRQGSKTLANLRARRELAVAWMPPSRAIAQLVKETKDPEAPYRFEMVLPEGFRLPVPTVSLYVVEGKVISIEKMYLVNNRTHEMVLCSAERVVFLKEGFFNPLLHVGVKRFAVADWFEVEGY